MATIEESVEAGNLQLGKKGRGINSLPKNRAVAESLTPESPGSRAGVSRVRAGLRANLRGVREQNRGPWRLGRRLGRSLRAPTSESPGWG